MEITPTSLLAVAKYAAMRCADYASSQSARRHDANSATRSDVKHKLDVECEALARELLLKAVPGSVILGEESCKVFDGPEPEAPAGVEWIVDPIDGTVNFFHNGQYWCCSIAARLDGEIVAGVVYSPESRLCYEAASDGPALCNGVPIHVSDETRRELSIVHTGEDKSLDDSAFMDFFSAIASKCQRPRMVGSAALDLCAVAHGRAEGYFQTGVYIWDVAAASLIIERAGGHCRIVKRRGGYRRAFLATNGSDAITEALLSCMPESL